MNLSFLLRALPAHETHNFRDVDITHITDDSRQAQRGALFVAYRGVNVDGKPIEWLNKIELVELRTDKKW